MEIDYLALVFVNTSLYAFICSLLQWYVVRRITFPMVGTRHFFSNYLLIV